MTINYAKAIELWKRAAELGNTEAYYNIGNAHLGGKGVKRDFEKARHYWVQGAVRGCNSKARSW